MMEPYRDQEQAERIIALQARQIDFWQRQMKIVMDQNHVMQSKIERIKNLLASLALGDDLA